MAIFNYVLEEFGKNDNIDLEIEIEYTAEKPEPMVMYYPDGSGYPGSPGGIDIDYVTVLSYDRNGRTVERAKFPKRFEILDQLVWKEINSNMEKWEERIAESLADEEYEPEYDDF